MMEPSNNTFRLFHRYNKLVRRGLVQPLTCKACGFAYITSADEEDNLVLECYTCDSKTRPGLGTIERVMAVVSEHFVEEE